jgi:hypothetical protein
MKNLTVENNKIYRVPTDEDAKERPMVEVRDYADDSWESHDSHGPYRLVCVAQKGYCRFGTLCRGELDSFVYARIDTGIVIPDGWRLVDHSEPWRTGAKYWLGISHGWGNQGDSAGQWFEQDIYIVPIDSPSPPEPQYRHFASWQEWWPHRDRWTVDTDGDIRKSGWFGADEAKERFQSGWRFLNDDGTPGEPYGVRV